MILVDTSVWIEMLKGRAGKGITEEQLLNFVTCGPVVQEVLQGLRSTQRAVAFRNAFLALPVLSDPLPVSLFLAAADLYRVGREKGRTIRSSADCQCGIAIGISTPLRRSPVCRSTGLIDQEALVL